MSASDNAAPRCFLCGAADAAPVAEIRRKPARETDFGVSADAYRRLVYQCRNCSAYFNIQHMVGADIYTRAYNEATYSRKLLETYARIRSLPEAQSDNKQRVRRVVHFNARQGRAPEGTSILDVGSGLCVFLAELKERGFQCYAVDPDPLVTRHALEQAKVDGAHAGTLDDFRPGRLFNIITFNKVLEHVPDPVRVLGQAKSLLAPGGFLYIELPDGEAALSNGGAVDREEFYIEHCTIFTPASAELLARAAGLRSVETHQIHEPSDKYTLYTFLEQR